MSGCVNEEGLRLYQHGFRTAEFPHRFSELRLGGMLQIQFEKRRVVVLQNLFQNLVMLFAFGFG